MRVVPGASTDAVVGVVEGEVRVRVAARAVEGAANERLLRFLSREWLRVPRSAVALTRGERGRSKTVRVEGVEVEAVRARLVDGG